jgi:cadmium resistance protein CadD (predicted permease)
MNVFRANHQQNVHIVACQNAVAGLLFINDVLSPLGLVGLFPIAIGIKELLDLRSTENDDDDDEHVKIVTRIHESRWRSYLPFITVATVT